MTALAAKFEDINSTWLQALLSLLVFTSALLPILALNGNLLLRYP